MVDSMSAKRVRKASAIALYKWIYWRVAWSRQIDSGLDSCLSKSSTMTICEVTLDRNHEFKTNSEIASIRRACNLIHSKYRESV